jgi:regulatory protein
MKITALQPQKHDPDRVSVFVDGAFRLGLAAQIARAGKLRVGQAVDEARLAELERHDLGWQARQAALRLLAVRPRSAAEIARLREQGLIDDAAFAGSLVRDRVRLRPQGARRMAGELRAKGVDEAIARAAIRETLDDEATDEAGLARRAAAKWRPRPGEEPAAARRRLHGFLTRRGFDGDVVREVIDEALPVDEGESH